MAYRRLPGSPPGLRSFTKKYSRFRGVDFANDPTQVDESRSPWAVNVVSDLSGFPEKRKGWKVLHELGHSGRVNGIFTFVEKVWNEEDKRFEDLVHWLAHVGTDLYDWSDNIEPFEPYVICTGLNDEKSASFVHGGKLYILDGANYLVYDGSKVADVASAAFIPTTITASPPNGSGTQLEAVNYLQPRQINTFGGTGTDKVFQLSATELDDDPLIITVTTTVNGVIQSQTKTEGTDFTVDRAAGKVTFTAAPPVGPSLSGVDNVTILFAKTRDLTRETRTFSGDGSKKAFTLGFASMGFDKVTAKVGNTVMTENSGFTLVRSTGVLTFSTAPAAGTDNIVVTLWRNGYADYIRKCRIATQFGYGNANRIFLSGNPDRRNWDFQSGLDDPTYFPDTGYTRIGSESTAIMGYLKQFDNLLIIKEDNGQDTGIFLRTAAMTDQAKVYFPLKQGVAGMGAVARGSIATLRDDPLFLTRQNISGVTLAGSVTQERTVVDRSHYINPRLRQEKNPEEAVAAVWNGYYVLCLNSRCYVADSRQLNGYEENFGYEWYYWTNVPARVLLEYNDQLFFGTEDGRICQFAAGPAVSNYADNVRTDASGNLTGECVGGSDGACWSTPFLDGGNCMIYKNIQKRGTGILAKPYTRSSGVIYYATEREYQRQVRDYTIDYFSFDDIDFERFTFNTLDRPQVVPTNTKAKKVLLFQMVIANQTPFEGFGILGAAVTFTAGGYVK